jgi:peptidoglycan L-alanyl-D-glutamate endopeptidase CwlK
MDLVVLANRDPSKLYPPFAAALDAALEDAHARGLMAYMFEGYRSPDRQMWLYAAGRTRKGSIVTRAKPFESWHQFGCAADIVFDGLPAPGIQWSWDGDYVGDRRGDYERLGAILMQWGLDWFGRPGSEFYELPHCQMTFGMTLPEARRLYAMGGLPAVWVGLDKLRGAA